MSSNNCYHLSVILDQIPPPSTGPIVESKDVCEKGKIFENLGTNVQNLKIF